MFCDALYRRLLPGTSIFKQSAQVCSYGPTDMFCRVIGYVWITMNDIDRDICEYRFALLITGALNCRGDEGWAALHLYIGKEKIKP